MKTKEALFEYCKKNWDELEFIVDLKQYAYKEIENVLDKIQSSSGFYCTKPCNLKSGLSFPESLQAYLLEQCGKESSFEDACWLTQCILLEISEKLSLEFSLSDIGYHFSWYMNYKYETAWCIAPSYFTWFFIAEFVQSDYDEVTRHINNLDSVNKIFPEDNL